MRDPVGRLLQGGAGRLRAVEVEFTTRAAFDAAARMLDADPTLATSVASGYLEGVEVVIVLDGGPPSYLRDKLR